MPELPPVERVGCDTYSSASHSDQSDWQAGKTLSKFSHAMSLSDSLLLGFVKFCQCLSTWCMMKSMCLSSHAPELRLGSGLRQHRCVRGMQAWLAQRHLPEFIELNQI